jgi:hypothetical protein
MQALAADELTQLGVLRTGAEPGLDPLWLALDGDGAVAGLNPEQPAFFWCDNHGSSLVGAGES